MKVAYKWKDLSKKWLTMENAMRKYKYQPNLSRRFKRTTFIVMILALGERIIKLCPSSKKYTCLILGEHILFITKIIIIIFDCSLFATEPVKTYFGAAFSQIFALTTYTHIKAIALEVRLKFLFYFRVLTNSMDFSVPQYFSNICLEFYGFVYHADVRIYC